MKAEEAIFKIETRYRELIESLPQTVFEIDPQGMITSVNLDGLKSFGYSKEDLENGVSAFQVFAPNDHQRLAENIQRILNEEPSGATEYLAQRKDGSTFPVIVYPVPIIHEHTVVGLRGVLVDITERKRMENVNAQLIRDLEAANTELKDFAYIVSHDLKAPLRAIGSLSQWLYTDYKDKFDEKGKAQLDLLMNRVNRMQNLIDGILEYSRVGRIQKEKEDFDPNSLVKEVIDSLSPPRHISIIIDNPLPMVHYEKTSFRQVLSNLIGNAVKYMDKPHGVIHIGCIRDGDYWKFFVKDNGPGVDEKYYDLVFQIFQTLNSRDDIESTGIGLSIVKKIVETYGGKVWIESELGKGSTFYFTIPMKGDKPFGGTSK
ncbi:MAG: ATP-binding protein [Methanoregula sp.]|jgi:PAS domain S-box-containing protein|uniref:ATP-binding protein n=1 Tax=Methanoregula sp. TaxID=2052170 RepID=UPI003D0965E5